MNVGVFYCCCCCSVMMLMTIATAPSGVAFYDLAHPVSTSVWTGSTAISHESGYISPASMEMYFYLRLGFNASVTGVWKDDLRIESSIFGKNSKDGEWKLVSANTDDTTIKRSLRCNAYKSYADDEERTQPDKEIGAKNQFCRDIIVYHVRWLEYRYYKVDLQFQESNINELAVRGFFNGALDDQGNHVLHTGVSGGGCGCGGTAVIECRQCQIGGFD